MFGLVVPVVVTAIFLSFFGFPALGLDKEDPPLLVLTVAVHLTVLPAVLSVRLLVVDRRNIEGQGGTD
ncbi:MAG: hypothetical protein AAF899_08105 [Pseudomonadota bacterium]